MSENEHSQQIALIGDSLALIDYHIQQEDSGHYCVTIHFADGKQFAITKRFSSAKKALKFAKAHILKVLSTARKRGQIESYKIVDSDS